MKIHFKIYNILNLINIALKEKKKFIIIPYNQLILKILYCLYKEGLIINYYKITSKIIKINFKYVKNEPLIKKILFLNNKSKYNKNNYRYLIKKYKKMDI